ncbi:MAG: ATP synthase subunit I [Desulfobacteraceae bacterium]|nr:MAG: ATP synthase subunit I [Desulfobacteraceae bacterium]
MEQIRETQKKYCSVAITFAIFAGISFFLFDLKPIGKGLILGTIFSIVNFILMGESLPMRIGQSKNKTIALSFLSIFFRYGLMAIPLIAAIKMEKFNLAATVCGLFMVQLVILADEIIRLIFNSTQKKTA